ncbi:hypothetical protein D3C81_1753630 [compost metagenome]
MISSAVMVETPGACRFCLAAVTTMVSSAASFLFLATESVSAVVSVCCAACAKADAPNPNPMSVAKE